MDPCIVGEAQTPTQPGVEFRRRGDAELEQLRHQVDQLKAQLRRDQETTLHGKLAEIEARLERAAGGASQINPNLLIQLLLKNNAPAPAPNVDLGPLLGQLMSSFLKLAQNAGPREEAPDRPGWMSIVENIAGLVLKHAAQAGQPGTAGQPRLGSGGAAGDVLAFPGNNGGNGADRSHGAPPDGVVGVVSTYLPQLLQRARNGSDPELSADWIAEAIEKIPGGGAGLDRPATLLYSQLVEAAPQAAAYAPWLRDFFASLKQAFSDPEGEDAPRSGDAAADNPDTGR